jgi:hypothetical protein
MAFVSHLAEVNMRHEIIPNLRYGNALAAIDFLCNAFGFERRAVYLDEQDPTRVQHAQLTWADRMIMVYSINDTEYARSANMKTVAQAGGPTVGRLYEVGIAGPDGLLVRIGWPSQLVKTA